MLDATGTLGTALLTVAVVIIADDSGQTHHVRHEHRRPFVLGDSSEVSHEHARTVAVDAAPVLVVQEPASIASTEQSLEADAWRKLRDVILHVVDEQGEEHPLADGALAFALTITLALALALAVAIGAEQGDDAVAKCGDVDDLVFRTEDVDVVVLVREAEGEEDRVDVVGANCSRINFREIKLFGKCSLSCFLSLTQ